MHTSVPSSVQNRWDQVQDFKWHRAEKNPNWSVLADEEAVDDEVWKDLVLHGRGVSVDAMLDASGVSKLGSDSNT